MTKIRIKNSKQWKKSNVITIKRFTTGNIVQKKTIDGWINIFINGLEVKCNYADHIYVARDVFSYGKYGNISGWHPVIGVEFFRPYMKEILNEAFNMKNGETRRIRVSRR